MGVADAGAEDKVQGASKQRIADVSVLPRHRVGFDRAFEARPHAEVRAIHEGAPMTRNVPDADFMPLASAAP